MGRKVNPREKIVPKTIGFNFRQHEFFNANPDFKADEYCRNAIDEQIRLSGQTKFLKEEENE